MWHLFFWGGRGDCRQSLKPSRYSKKPLKKLSKKGRKLEFSQGGVFTMLTVYVSFREGISISVLDACWYFILLSCGPTANWEAERFLSAIRKAELSGGQDVQQEKIFERQVFGSNEIPPSSFLGKKFLRCCFLTWKDRVVVVVVVGVGQVLNYS